MTKLLVSFSTRPGLGSEGGVGWNFTKAAVEWTAERNEPLKVLIDMRDADQVASSISGLERYEHVDLVPVAIPSLVAKRYGDSRARQTCLAWTPRARRVAASIVSDPAVNVAHQVTFATGTLPSAITGLRNVKKIWGPIGVPFNALDSHEDRSILQSASLRAAWAIANRNCKHVDHVIATNSGTADVLERHRPEVEPNIFLPDLPFAPVTHNRQLVLCGLLIDRKRPWIAIEAMARPILKDNHLVVVGDGPLRADLERRTCELGVSDRVTFLGSVDHESALRHISQSRCLVHPSRREGAAWVVGEAAASGVPAVVFDGSGAESTVRLSNNGGAVIRVTKGQDAAESFALAVHEVLSRPKPEGTDRWSALRIPRLLDRWWSEDGKQ